MQLKLPGSLVLLLAASSALAATLPAPAEYPPAAAAAAVTEQDSSSSVASSSSTSGGRGAANPKPATIQKEKDAAKLPHAVEAPASTTPEAVAPAPAVVQGPNVPVVNQLQGTVDAPVDGLDGKPHDGPGLRETKEKGSGDVGISGGTPHIDISNPPPHTGEHEIVNVEDLAEGADRKGKQQALKEGSDADGDDDGDAEDGGALSSDSGPVPSSGHKEYIVPGTDTLKDPPVNTPSHLQQTLSGSDPSSISQPLHSFVLSFIMIIFSEIGDKTFLVAALMAMKHARLVVFSAAFSALIAMSVLSAVLGHAVPTLIPKRFTAFLAGGLFLVFGLRMVSEGLKMERGTANVQEEMKEVEKEMEEKTAAAARDRASSISRKLEAGRGGSRTLRRSTSSPSLSDEDEDDYAQARGAHAKGPHRGALEGIANLAGLLLSPAWVQTFVMTFLGEWGDRSQIATIAMAAGQDYWYVTVGAITGHAVCTGIAVVGGRLLASRISVRNVTLGGAAAFLVFGFLYLGEAMYA